MRFGKFAWLAVCLALLSGCKDDEASTAPPPAELTRDAIGHYCQMIVMDHKGPKGQIFLEGEAAPVWFSSVRDTIAFTLLPDEPKTIAAIYVNDMGRATWDRPEPNTWIDAKTAHYVIGSSRRGGMGAPEAVPFADLAAAKRFADTYGGEIYVFDEIPPDAILSSDEESMEGGDMDQQGAPGEQMSHQHGAGDDAGADNAAVRSQPAAKTGDSDQ
jgi:copper chaperone NosL